MRRAIPSILVSLLTLALVAEPSAARWPDGSEIDGPTVVPPEERDAFGVTAPLSSPPRLLDPLALPRFGPGSLLGLGIDVGQFRLLDPGTTISFDLRLTWPGAPTFEALDLATLQPYIAFGPTLFVADSPDPASPLGPRADPTLAVGVKAGAGLSWQLDRDTALFGEYRITRGSSDWLGPVSGRSSGEVSGFDILYGLRLRF